MPKEHRYTLTLPEELYEEMQKMADANSTSIKDVVRKCLKLSLEVIRIEEDPFSELIVRMSGVETRLRFIL